MGRPRERQAHASTRSEAAAATVHAEPSVAEISVGARLGAAPSRVSSAQHSKRGSRQYCCSSSTSTAGCRQPTDALLPPGCGRLTSRHVAPASIGWMMLRYWLMEGMERNPRLKGKPLLQEEHLLQV